MLIYFDTYRSMERIAEEMVESYRKGESIVVSPSATASFLRNWLEVLDAISDMGWHPVYVTKQMTLRDDWLWEKFDAPHVITAYCMALDIWKRSRRSA